jgi:hypothetical protein
MDPIFVELKRCTKCGIEKPETRKNFYYVDAKDPSKGFRHFCILCWGRKEMNPDPEKFGKTLATAEQRKESIRWGQNNKTRPQSAYYREGNERYGWSTKQGEAHRRLSLEPRRKNDQKRWIEKGGDLLVIGKPVPSRSNAKTDFLPQSLQSLSQKDIRTPQQQLEDKWSHFERMFLAPDPEHRIETLKLIQTKCSEELQRMNSYEMYRPYRH